MVRIKLLRFKDVRNTCCAATGAGTGAGSVRVAVVRVTSETELVEYQQENAEISNTYSISVQGTTLAVVSMIYPRPHLQQYD